MKKEVKIENIQLKPVYGTRYEISVDINKKTHYGFVIEIGGKKYVQKLTLTGKRQVNTDIKMEIEKILNK
jgi:hypothetical protein